MELNQNTVDILSRMFRFSFFDQYILENHKEIFRLASRINNIDIEEKPLQVEMTLQEMIRLEQEFLFSLKPKYKDKFIEDFYINNRIVRLDSENGEGFYSRDRFFNDYTIYFSKGNNLNNLVTLSHEFIHCLSFQYPKIQVSSTAYTKYTEMLSILGELKFIDFLKENLGSNEKIESYAKSYRTRYTPMLNRFLFIEPLLDFYLSKAEFTPEKIFEFLNTKIALNIEFTVEEIENLLEINSYYKMLGKNMMIKKLNSMTKKENYLHDFRMDHLEQYVEEYKHILGLAKASFLHQNNISNEEFVKLIENINTVEIDEFEKLLPKMSEDDLVEATKKEYCYKKI